MYSYSGPEGSYGGREYRYAVSTHARKGGRGSSDGMRSNDLVSLWSASADPDFIASILVTKLVATTGCAKNGSAARTVASAVAPTSLLEKKRQAHTVAATVRPDRVARPKGETPPGPKTAKDRPRDAAAKDTPSLRAPVARTRSYKGVPAYVAAHEAETPASFAA